MYISNFLLYYVAAERLVHAYIWFGFLCADGAHEENHFVTTGTRNPRGHTHRAMAQHNLCLSYIA
jgi:hypothetical protein